VFDDFQADQIDILIGTSGEDWFWTDRSSGEDKITGLTSGEQVREVLKPRVLGRYSFAGSKPLPAHPICCEGPAVPWWKCIAKSAFSLVALRPVRRSDGFHAWI
jgi:hypothetical protein